MKVECKSKIIKNTTDPNHELRIIENICGLLRPLSNEGRARVVTYISNLFQIADKNRVFQSDLEENDEEASVVKLQKYQPYGSSEYPTFAELYAAVQPKKKLESVLLSAYWIQAESDDKRFMSQAVNTQLKHLGIRISNITSAINRLKDRDPSWILQVNKSGKSKQARKIYMVTDAGMKRVREMINE